jgi:hypothetical protein
MSSKYAVTYHISGYSVDKNFYQRVGRTSDAYVEKTALLSDGVKMPPNSLIPSAAM